MKPPRVRQQIHRELDRRLHAGDGPDDRAPVALQLPSRQGLEPDRRPAGALRPLRVDVGPQRRQPAGVAGRLDLPQDDPGIPHAVIEQRVDLRPIRIDQAAAPTLARRRRTSSERPTDRLGGDPQLRGDVTLVDTTFHECFNHQEVLRS